MRSTLTLFGLVAIALAAPASTSNNDVVNQDHVLYLVSNNDNNDNALRARQDRCDWDSYCLPEYQKCVKSCNSLKNADW